MQYRAFESKTKDEIVGFRMNSKTPASVKSIMTLYSSLKFSSVLSRNADFHKQQVACFRFDVFPVELLVSNSALIRVTFLS